MAMHCKEMIKLSKAAEEKMKTLLSKHETVEDEEENINIEELINKVMSSDLLKSQYMIKWSSDTFPKDPKEGEVWIVGEKTYTYVNNTWDCLYPIEDLEKEEDKPKELKQYECKYCGGKIKYLESHCPCCNSPLSWVKYT